MIQILSNVAATGHEAATEAGGIAALGLDVKAFLFQVVTFILLLLILRKWAFPILVKTLEDRRIAVEKSIDQAKETEAAMQNAEKHIATLLAEARDEAQSLVAAGHREATKMVEEAEAKASQRAESIVKDAQTSMEHELSKARAVLQQETAALVAEATGAILKEKVDASKNAELISKAIKSSTKETN